jgi:hypothetical protein
VAMSCPGCGEELPAGARFCGACGRTLATPPPPGLVACPLCRTEVPVEARFCGACGQPLGSSASFAVSSNVSMPEGMIAVPLLQGLMPRLAEAQPVVRRALLEEPFADVDVIADVDVDLEVAPAPKAGAAQDGYLELAAPAIDAEDDDRTGGAGSGAFGEAPEADNLEFELSGIDDMASRGKREQALAQLLAVPGLAREDPRRQQRLETLGRELGESFAEQGRLGRLVPAKLRAELGRLVRLCGERAYREALREQLAPAATAAEALRVREFVRDGHLHAALTLVETVLGAGRRVIKLRILQHDVVQAVVAQACAEQRAGDKALRGGDAAKAQAHYEEALTLLENDRALLARLERAKTARPPVQPPARPSVQPSASSAAKTSVPPPGPRLSRGGPSRSG